MENQSFTKYNCKNGVVTPCNPYIVEYKGSFTVVKANSTNDYAAFETWLSTQPTIAADPSINDGVYKVDELEIVKQHLFMGEWLVLDNNQVSAYIDRGLEYRIYATLKQPVKQEEKPERLYTEAEVKLIATRFARQSSLMNDITSNDTITSFENWFKPENF